MCLGGSVWDYGRETGMAQVIAVMNILLCQNRFYRTKTI